MRSAFPIPRKLLAPVLLLPLLVMPPACDAKTCSAEDALRAAELVRQISDSIRDKIESKNATISPEEAAAFEEAVIRLHECHPKK